jgi:hypothetical protein
MEPAWRRTISPGTISEIFISVSAPSQDESAGLHSLAQRIDGIGRASVQNVGEADAQDDHCGDDDGGFQLADDRRDQGNNKQLNHQRAFEPVKHVGPETQALEMGQFIGAIFVQTFFRLFGAQPFVRGVKRIERILDRHYAEIRQSPFVRVHGGAGRRLRDGPVCHLCEQSLNHGAALP